MRSDVPPSPAVPTADSLAATHPADAAESTRGQLAIGLSIWFIAAACLVVGIVIGFTSGYAAGRRGVPALTPADAAAVDGLPELSPAYEPRESSTTFTEGTVSEPVRVDPEPIVAAPDIPDAPETPAAAPQAESRRLARPPVTTTAAGPGSLQVLSRPSGATVRLDGRVVGRTPLVISDVRAGSHDVRIELAGFRGWLTSVDVRPGARARVAASLEQ